VIASKIGAITELITHGKNGFLVKVRDSQDIASKIQMMWEDIPLCMTMGDNARNEYLCRYSPDNNYRILMNAYMMVVNR
jgi:glycosyltransferase involved in cell wall biosynthesis